MTGPTRPRLSNRVHRPAFLNHSERWKSERSKAMNAKRDPVITAMYSSKQWRVLRAQVLEEAQGRCAVKICARAPSVVDHVRPHRGSNALFFDRDNLQALCKVCHDRKTARYDGAFGRVPRPPSRRRIVAQNALYAGGQDGGDMEGGQ